MPSTVVLIHAFPLDSSMWEPQTAALTAAGYKVLTPNLPGFGGTPAWSAERYTIEHFAEFIHHTILEQAGGSAIVGGCSMGGYVLLSLLASHPEVVRAAMLIDTRAEADSPDGRAKRMEMIQQVQSRGPVAAADAMLDRLLSKHGSKILRDKIYALMLKQSTDGIIGAQHAMARRPDRTAMLAQIAVPTLVAVGAYDAITPPAVALAMHQALPSGTLAQIARAGHLANVEAPEAFNNILLAFLNTLKCQK